MIEGVVDFMVENRSLGVVRLLEKDSNIKSINPNDLIMSPEVFADLNIIEGSFFLHEHCLYEPYIPYRIVCKTRCKLLEIEGNLFKVLFFGILSLLRQAQQTLPPANIRPPK